MQEISPFLTVSIPYASAFLAGVFGGVHCIGMCGGVSGAMVYGIPQGVRDQRGLTPFVFSYNLGRVMTYVLLGALIGALGARGGDLVSDYGGWVWLRVLAGLLMIMMGLYLANWWRGLVVLEMAGAKLVWERLKPLSRNLLPVTSVPQALLFGLVWGLLPCGLVYTMLVWSVASGGWLQGGGFLLAFGLGTLPVMLFIGLMAERATQVLQRKTTRYAAGTLVILFGLWTIISSLLGQVNVGLGCLPPG